MLSLKSLSDTLKPLSILDKESPLRRQKRKEVLFIKSLVEYVNHFWCWEDLSAQHCAVTINIADIYSSIIAAFFQLSLKVFFYWCADQEFAQHQVSTERLLCNYSDSEETISKSKLVRIVELNPRLSSRQSVGTPTRLSLINMASIKVPKFLRYICLSTV